MVVVDVFTKRRRGRKPRATAKKERARERDGECRGGPEVGKGGSVEEKSSFGFRGKN